MKMSFKEKNKSNYPIILSSPHSGVKFPKQFFKQSNVLAKKNELLKVSDLFVDELIKNIKPLDLVKLTSEYSRSFIDLNRDIREIDLEKVKNISSKDIKFLMSSYTQIGFGLIHTKTFDQKDVYTDKLDLHDINHRIEKFYKPWHQSLLKNIKRSKQYNNQIFLLDFHSMPSDVFKNNTVLKKKDIIIGDQYGRSADPEFSKTLINHFEEIGYDVGRNIPYQGGYISKNYGNPNQGIHSIQIEIRRDLYMDEELLLKKKEFEVFRGDLEKVIENFIKPFISDSEKKFAAQ